MRASHRVLAVTAAALLATAGMIGTVSGQDGEAQRNETLIIGFEGGQIASPDIGNPFVPARWPMISAGLHQAVFESLFYLNYETGELEPWLAEVL